MSALEFVFLGFALLTFAAALLAVTSRFLVHSALWLVVALGGVAGVYLSLGAEVVALVQILVYVGAVVVLVLFALMMTRSPLGPRKDLTLTGRPRGAAAVIGVSVALLLGGTLAYAVQDAQIAPDLANGSPLALGRALFSGWVLAFEVLSLLLVAALIGAIAISRPTTDAP